MNVSCLDPSLKGLHYRLAMCLDVIHFAWLLSQHDTIIYSLSWQWCQIKSQLRMSVWHLWACSQHGSEHACWANVTQRATSASDPQTKHCLLSCGQKHWLTYFPSWPSVSSSGMLGNRNISQEHWEWGRNPPRVLSVPGTVSGSSTILTRIKRLLKIFGHLHIPGLNLRLGLKYWIGWHKEKWHHEVKTAFQYRRCCHYLILFRPGNSKVKLNC